MQTQRRIALPAAPRRPARHVADVIAARGYDVVTMSRSSGVDVLTGAGLMQALKRTDAVIDVATSPDQEGATEFFTASARNLQEVGKQAGVRRIVVVSIIGTDRFSAGYGAAKVVHERATLSGPIPARILRAA